MGSNETIKWKRAAWPTAARGVTPQRSTLLKCCSSRGADGGARAARWRGRIWCFDVSRRLPECKTDAIGLGERPSARSGWSGAVRACRDASSLRARLTMGARVAADAARRAGELLVSRMSARPHKVRPAAESLLSGQCSSCCSRTPDGHVGGALHRDLWHSQMGVSLVRVRALIAVAAPGASGSLHARRGRLGGVLLRNNSVRRRTCSTQTPPPPFKM